MGSIGPLTLIGLSCIAAGSCTTSMLSATLSHPGNHADSANVDASTVTTSTLPLNSDQDAKGDGMNA